MYRRELVRSLSETKLSSEFDPNAGGGKDGKEKESKEDRQQHRREI